MKPGLCLLFALATLWAPAPGRAAARAADATYVIPIRGMIERALVYVIRRGVTQAIRENAGAITFAILTPLWPAGAIAFLTVGVNLIVDWFLHVASRLKD